MSYQDQRFENALVEAAIIASEKTPIEIARENVRLQAELRLLVMENADLRQHLSDNLKPIDDDPFAGE